MSDDLPDLSNCSDHDLILLTYQAVRGLKDHYDDHECRIRSVEGNQLKILGVGALAGFITGWLGRTLGGNP